MGGLAPREDGVGWRHHLVIMKFHGRNDDGVMAGDKLDAPNEGQEIIYQKYSRGQDLAREVASGAHRYDIFKINDTFELFDDVTKVELVIVGFTAHFAKENAYMAHMRNPNDESFYRATGVNFNKHLKSPLSSFRKVVDISNGN